VLRDKKNTVAHSWDPESNVNQWISNEVALTVADLKNKSMNKEDSIEKEISDDRGTP